MSRNSNKGLIKGYYRTFGTNDVSIANGILCGCIPPRANKWKQGFNDPSQPLSLRISQLITSSLGGRITYGNFNNPVVFNYIGGWEGQPGGTHRLLRNKF